MTAAARRHVLISGGSRGLGLALVEALLADGYAVSTCSRAPSAALTERLADPALAVRLFWQACDLADADACAAFVAAAVAAHPTATPYGLINNAGIARDGILATFPTIETEGLLAVNLLAPLHLSRAFLRVLLERQGPGRLINISSIIGQRGYTGLAAYSAAKAGLDGLTRALAREVGRRGITVNGVAPGYLETEMSQSLAGAQRAQIIRRTPVGRLGTPADVVPVVRFLLSDDAAFVSGQTLVVDGGLTC